MRLIRNLGLKPRASSTAFLSKIVLKRLVLPDTKDRGTIYIVQAEKPLARDNKKSVETTLDRLESSNAKRAGKILSKNLVIT